ncbi:hypothetical protein [Streptomyces noursei]|nr:hypothetical protein [Streptomyces noursei]MCZ1014702.1 hypothetical protein [Streptomyces noursei]GGW97026.1 hypothetical protein GCM10010341_18060 [Streptomyces noursei]
MENATISMDEFDLDLDVDIMDSATVAGDAQESKLMTQVCPSTSWRCGW